MNERNHGHDQTKTPETKPAEAPAVNLGASASSDRTAEPTAQAGEFAKVADVFSGVSAVLAKAEALREKQQVEVQQARALMRLVYEAYPDLDRTVDCDRRMVDLRQDIQGRYRALSAAAISVALTRSGLQVEGKFRDGRGKHWPFEGGDVLAEGLSVTTSDGKKWEMALLHELKYDHLTLYASDEHEERATRTWDADYLPAEMAFEARDFVLGLPDASKKGPR